MADIARIAVVAVIAVSLIGPFINVVGSSSGVQAVENETVTADYDSYVELEGYSIVDGSVRVDDGAGETYSAGADYELNQSAGSIHALSSGNITDGQTIEVSYDYEATSGTTTTIVGLLPMFMALLVLVVMAGAATDMMP